MKQIEWMLAVVFLGTMAPWSAVAFDPTEQYEERQMEGWTLRINRTLLRDSQLAEEVLREMRRQLIQIARAVPTPALAKLRNVVIWVEEQDRDEKCMCYHPSREWLTEHAYNPDKAGCVELGNARNFLAWTHEQPWMVLHELAHSYHHQVLGYDNAEIRTAYGKAVTSTSYEQVLHINGQTVRHYALTSDQEYFAECTEAFFGTNDMYPFVGAELKQHDPTAFETLGRVWGRQR
jgi:hypothetical protein